MMPREGTLIADRYRLERKVGGGRVAATWLVQDQVTQAHCAVKLLHRSMNEHAEALARFSLEDRLGRELTGAYFAERIGSGSWQSIRYIAWRWYDGECLRVLFDRTPKQDAQTVNSVVQETCNALTAVHGAGYTHGDLKPENIFFAEGGEKARQLKLLGFGVASRLTQPLLGIQGRRTPGMIVGTPLYLSPDLILGRVPRGGQGDLWALAVIVYEALTGRPPFLGDDLGQVLQAILDRRAPKPTSITNNLPATLDQWWAQALEQSFATAGDFATALSRALAPALRSSRTQRSASLPASADSTGVGRDARAVVVGQSAGAHARRASEAANAGAAAGMAKPASVAQVAAPAARAGVKAASGGPPLPAKAPLAADGTTERAAGGAAGRERASDGPLRSEPSAAPGAASKGVAVAAGETRPARTTTKALPSGPAAGAGASRVAASSVPTATPAPARASEAKVSAKTSDDSRAGGTRPSQDIAATLLGTGAGSAGTAASSAAVPAAPSGAPALEAGARAASPAPTQDADATPRAPEAAPKRASAEQTSRPAGVGPGAQTLGARGAKALPGKDSGQATAPQATAPQATAPQATAPQATSRQAASKAASAATPGKDGAPPREASAGAVSANAALFRAAVAAAVDSNSSTTPQRSRKAEGEATDSAAVPRVAVPAAMSEPTGAAEEPARRASTAGASHTSPGLGPAAASMIRALQSAAAEAAAASIRVVGGGSEAAQQRPRDASAARGLKAGTESSFAPLPSPVQDLSSTGTRKTLVGIIPPAQLGAVATGSSNRTAAPGAAKRDRSAIEGAPCRSIDVSEVDTGAESNPFARRGSHPTVPFARPRAARRRGSRGPVQDPSSLDPSPHDPSPHDTLPHDLLPHELLSHDTVPELSPVLEPPEHRAGPSGDPWSFRTMRTSGTLRIVLGSANRLPHLVAGLLVCLAAALVIFVLGRSPVAGTGPIGQTTNSLEPPAAPAPRAPLAPTSAPTGIASPAAEDGRASVHAEGNAAPEGVPDPHSEPALRPEPGERTDRATPTAAEVTPFAVQPAAGRAVAPGTTAHMSPVTPAKPKAPERMAAPGTPARPSMFAPNSGARLPNPTPSRAVSPPPSSFALPPPAAAKGSVPPRAPPGKPGSNNPGTQTASPSRPANGDFDFGI